MILSCASAVSIAFLIFQMIFPYRPPRNADFSIIAQNKEKYNRLEMWAIFWIFLSAGLICGSVFIIGSQIRDNLFSSGYEYILAPTNTFWFFPGVVLGFGLIRIPMEFVYKMILKGEYYFYTQYTNVKHGFDGEKVWRPLEFVLTFSGIIIFILGMNWFIRLDTNGKIEINELFSLKTHTYNLSDISEISHQDKYITTKGIEKDIPTYTIEMKDGYKWNSHTYTFFSIQKDDDALKEKMDRLSKLTEVKIKNNPSH